MDLPKRKQNRLPAYDYSDANAYFVTVCTEGRKNLFWTNVGATNGRPQDISLSEQGRIVDEHIRQIPNHYPAVSVDCYVIMPNHIHLLLQIHSTADGRPMVAPTISTVINQMKGVISKNIGFPVWQKGFYDHVIRGEADYQETWQYIVGNPGKWADDKLYNSNSLINCPGKEAL